MNDNKGDRIRHRKNEDHQSVANWWRALCAFAPVAIFLKFYSIGIMCWDLTYLVFYTASSIVLSLINTIRPPPLKSVKDEIAVIVGASRGVGREIAYQLAKLNAKVICIDINENGNTNTVNGIKQRGGIAFGLTCDVTNKDEVDKICRQIYENIGYITMLFHCCGVPSPRSLFNEPPPIRTTLDVSIVSHFHLLDQIIPKMRKQEYGHIVLLTSVAGLSGNKHQMPLSVSQFAVQGIFESITDDNRLSRCQDTVRTTLVHIYPFIVSEDLADDIRLRIPSYFGVINASLAATQIIEGVRRNYMEISIPGYLLYLGHIVKLLPRRAIYMLRELLDTGVDFG